MTTNNEMVLLAAAAATCELPSSVVSSSSHAVVSSSSGGRICSWNGEASSKCPLSSTTTSDGKPPKPSRNKQRPLNSSCSSSSSDTTSGVSTTTSDFPSSHSCASLLPKVAAPEDEIEVGRHIGQGAFSNIFEVKHTKASERLLLQQQEQQDDQDCSTTLQKKKKNTSKKQKLVIKTLRKSSLSSLSLAKKSIADLKREGQILASLNHRHDMVSIFGWTFGGDEEDEDEDSYNENTTQNKETMSPSSTPFLVLERLDETLQDKLSHWRDNLGYYQSARKNILSQRTTILLDLAEALQYIHSRNIIHRDIKPGNIGFIQRGGILKLFDFGVARVLPEGEDARRSKNQHNDDETFCLTGVVGTIRYMSPECGRRDPYNCKSDVYSFGLVCHEVLTLAKPYSDALLCYKHQQNVDKFIKENVWRQGGKRPHLSSSSDQSNGDSSSSWLHWPESLSRIVKRCWDDDISNRPTMREAQALLTEALPLLWQRTSYKQQSFFSKKFLKR